MTQTNIKHEILGIILNKTELNVKNLNEMAEEQRQQQYTDIEHTKNNKIMKPVNKYKFPQNVRFGMALERPTADRTSSFTKNIKMKKKKITNLT